MKCKAIKSQGGRCSRECDSRSKYCWQHKGGKSSAKKTAAKKTTAKKTTAKKTTAKKSPSPGPKCKEYLKDKIAINMREYKAGRFVSRQQALAVSYSQVKKDHPNCKRFFSR